MTAPLRPVVITGVGVISCVGDSPGGLHEALCEGQSGLHPVESFATTDLYCELAGEVKGFSPETYLGKGNFRPLDRTARLAASAANLALETTGLEQEGRRQREVGLVLGTVFGSIHTIAEFDRRTLVAGPLYAKPMDFANSVINAAAGQTAIWHGLPGVNATISGGAASGLLALAYAADLIGSGRCEIVLAGGAEELCFESCLGHERAGWIGGSSGGDPVPVPFHLRRNGFALAEGAALLVLESADSAAARGAPVIGEIAGYATSFCGPEREAHVAGSIARTISLALDESGVAPEEVDFLSASANGSVGGDASEAQGIAAAFGEIAQRLPVTAVKSVLGESLGASGALQTVAAIESLRSGRLPGIRGLEEVEPGFLLTEARAETRPVGSGIGLINAVGWDGHLCALVLRKGVDLQ